MTEFKLAFCPQCGTALVTMPSVGTEAMRCVGCRLTFAAVRHEQCEDLVVLFIAPTRTTADGTVIPAGVAVEAGLI